DAAACWGGVEKMRKVHLPLGTPGMSKLPSRSHLPEKGVPCTTTRQVVEGTSWVSSTWPMRWPGGAVALGWLAGQAERNNATANHEARRKGCLQSGREERCFSR